MDWMDFNRDGEVDGFETYVGLQMMAGSRQEAIALTGDDAFYTGSDSLEEDEDKLTDELEMAGLDIDELADMDEDELRDALEDAGLDPAFTESSHCIGEREPVLLYPPSTEVSPST